MKSIVPTIVLSVLCQAVALPAQQTVLIAEVPHVRQKPDFCGEACAEMCLRKLGKPVDQCAVFNMAGVDPVLGRGCRAAELARALQRLGIKTGNVHAVAHTQTTAQWEAALADLRAGIPSIVCMRRGGEPEAGECFRLLLGFDGDARQVIYHEPAQDDGAYRRMPLKEFLGAWPLKDDKARWTVIRIPVRPGKITAPAPPTGFTPADYAQHIMALKRKVPPTGFTIVIEPPFVVVGDEDPKTVRDRSARTVKWAVDMLKKDYFGKDPRHILDIWLLKDNASYRKHARSVFGEEPGTPFGYYSSRHRSLVMNISTGGGTLVHEIVHPFVGANFPQCPSWFNEGLASLYEQSREKGGHIHGLTNWRLKGLQEVIREGRVRTFRDLTSTSEREFYDLDAAIGYGQARYLCYYLQQKGLLREFYRSFRDNVAKDPTGYDTLKAVLKEEDMTAFQKRWEAYVLDLRYP